MKSSSMFPSGPKKKKVGGPFLTKPTPHKTPKAVAKAKAVAYSGQPRKNGAPFSDGD
jgi:hypothetical protein